jgi:hypothetical protein
MATQIIETSPIRNSTLNKHRQFVEGKNINYEFLKKYLHFGQLVDALITEPNKIDFDNRILDNVTRYENQRYEYNEYDFNLALRMRDSFYNDPLSSSVVGVAEKYVFSNDEFTLIADDGTEWILPTDGELDLAALNIKIGADVKMTTATSQEAFTQKIVDLHYDQQAAYYMDNTNIDKFVIIGISRKRKEKGGVDYKTGAQKIFHYTMERGDKRYLSGRNRYQYWMKELVKYRLDNNEAVFKDVLKANSNYELPFFMEAS